MQRYACLFLLLCSFSSAHASLPEEMVDETVNEWAEEEVSDLTTDDITAFVRVSPEANIEKSDIFEMAPEEAMEEVDLSEDNASSSGRSEARSRSKSVKRCSGHNRASSQASFYASGQWTAEGERFNKNAMTAAHKSLPFGSQVKVTNLKNQKSVVVTINDRGPFIPGRVIDLSRGSFAKIAPLGQGVARVKMEVVTCGK